MVFQARLLQAAGATPAADAVLRRAEPILGPGMFMLGRQQFLTVRARTELQRGAVEQARRSLAALRETEEPDEAAANRALLIRTALLQLIEGAPDAARRSALRTLEEVPDEGCYLDLGGVLIDLAELAVLGLPFPGLEATVAERLGSADLPPFLSLSRDVLHAALHPEQPQVLLAGAAAAGDARVGHRQAVVAVLGMIFRARAHLLYGETEEGETLLRKARAQARELAHTWLELAVLRLGHTAGLPRDDDAARSIQRLLRERNPEQPDRVVSLLDSWLPEDETH